MEFDGKNVVVTGATSGIGKSTAQGFVSAGARVAAVARRKNELEQLSSLFAHGRMLSIPADLTSPEQRKNCVAQILEKLGNVDILVHAAGIIASGTIENTAQADWDRMMNINLTSVFDLTQQLLPTLIQRKGNIVCVSSVAGLRSFPGVLAYSVSKAALDQFTRCVALELAPKGVRINAVNPGVVVTGLHRNGGMNEEQYQAFLERSKTTHPLGRVGTSEEIADLILFLASDRASWITGGTYSIDGGRALTCAR
ncbi:MAG TPA: glucose 1-dehydrogenase [Acidobacteriota bacterium]|nr:glucose 1-dehydrogenase [Acidobacteriota bacterium]